MQDGQKKLFFSLRKSFFPFENMRWMFNKLCEISFKGTSRQPFVFLVYYISTGSIFWPAHVDQIICWTQLAFPRILLMMLVTG